MGMVTIYYLTAKPSINDYTIYRGFIFSYTLLLNKDSHCKAIYSYLFYIILTLSGRFGEVVISSFSYSFVFLYLVLSLFPYQQEGTSEPDSSVAEFVLGVV